VSSCIAVKHNHTFIISTDSVAFPGSGEHYDMKASTHKLFRIGGNLLVACTGNFPEYVRFLSDIADIANGDSYRAYHEILKTYRALSDASIFAFIRSDGHVKMTSMEGERFIEDRAGVISLPSSYLSEMFTTLYESEGAKAIRGRGALAIATMVGAFGRFSAELCPDLSAPFDTVIFGPKGTFTLTGGIQPLPIDQIS
jgi:hypothetical protein